MSSKTLPAIAAELYDLLNPLELQDRRKVLASVLALMGDENAATKGNGGPADSGLVDKLNGRALGPAASRWTKQNSISVEMLENVFHFDGTGVTIIADSVPGTGKKDQTINAYVLEGIRALLATDQPSFQDGDAVSLCKHLGCHDAPNHASNRKALGSKVAGSKDNGFTLPAPGLKAGAEIVRQIANAGGA